LIDDYCQIDHALVVKEGDLRSAGSVMCTMSFAASVVASFGELRNPLGPLSTFILAASQIPMNFAPSSRELKTPN
jgi:hypothetical protein